MQDDPLSAIKTATLSGRKIEAIKLYREAFGVGLAEAKSAVEHLETSLRTQGPQAAFLPPEHPPMPEAVLASIRTYIMSGEKIAAIKAYRDHNPVGLAEAKAVIDQMEDTLRTQSPGAFAPPPKMNPKGCVLALLVFAILAYGIWRMMH